MERLSACPIVTDYFWHCPLQPVGIADPTFHGVLLLAHREGVRESGREVNSYGPEQSNSTLTSLCLEVGEGKVIPSSCSRLPRTDVPTFLQT